MLHSFDWGCRFDTSRLQRRFWICHPLESSWPTKTPGWCDRRLFLARNFLPFSGLPIVLFLVGSTPTKKHRQVIWIWNIAAEIVIGVVWVWSQQNLGKDFFHVELGGGFKVFFWCYDSFKDHFENFCPKIWEDYLVDYFSFSDGLETETPVTRLMLWMFF